MEENVQLDEGFGKERNESLKIPYLKRDFFPMKDPVEISSAYQNVFRYLLMTQTF